MPHIIRQRSLLLIAPLVLLLLMAATPGGASRASSLRCDDQQSSGCQEPAQPHAENSERQGFRQLPPDRDLMHDRRYMRVSGDADILDAPNGNVVEHLPDGFNFITVQSIEGDWVQASPGRWLHNSQLEDTNYVVSDFTGIFWPQIEPQHISAWLLVNLYPSLEPGGSPVESNGLHYRYSRIDILDEVEVDGWRWYQIGPDQWVEQTKVAKVLPVERPEDVETERWISIDLYEQVLIAYEGDSPVFATLVSTGRTRFPTQEGTFSIYWRRPRTNMSWGDPGDNFYFLEEVPWTMYYDGGRAIHGAYWHDGFGYRRSSGCVNLSLTDAHWLYHWVAEDMGHLSSPDIEEDGIQVYVYSSGEYR